MKREAERKLQLALAHSPAHAKAHLELAKLYLEAGKREEATRAYEKARELDTSLKLPGEHSLNQLDNIS